MHTGGNLDCELLFQISVLLYCTSSINVSSHLIEPQTIWGPRRPDDQRLDLPDVVLLIGHRHRCIRQSNDKASNVFVEYFSLALTELIAFFKLFQLLTAC